MNYINGEIFHVYEQEDSLFLRCQFFLLGVSIHYHFNKKSITLFANFDKFSLEKQTVWKSQHNTEGQSGG